MIDKVIRSKRKTIGLEVNSNAKLIVRAPLTVPLIEIEKLIQKKTPWIERSRQKALAKKASIVPKTFSEGELFPFLGISYPLVLVERRRPKLSLGSNTFTLSRYHLPQAKDIFINWYKKQARRIIADRLERYCHSFPERPEVRITSATTRWGSCNSQKKTLNFTWRLVMATLEIVDYIVIHELAHLKEPNHSRNFWKIIENTLPNYKEKRYWLKKNGHQLTV